MSQAASRSTRDEPNSEKGRAIVEVARELGPGASNPEVAEEVGNRIDEDEPDPSWVSRVRSKYLNQDDEDVRDTDDTTRTPPPTGSSDAPDHDGVDDLLIRVDMIAGRLERFTNAVEDLGERVAEIEDRIDDEDLPDDVVTTDDLADVFEEMSADFADA